MHSNLKPISNTPLAKSLVKVFSKVISEVRYIKTLSSTLQGCPKTRKNTKPLEELRFKENYKKRELAISFFFWFVFILIRYCDSITR